jgi:alpha-L-fucosidase 2
VRGLRARGGFEVDLHWRGGKLVSAEVRSADGGDFFLRVGTAVALQRVGIPPGGTKSFAF